nr:TIM44-like domain-containing protein [uncultured Pseudodesulfovibrio sp.]
MGRCFIGTIFSLMVLATPVFAQEAPASRGGSIFNVLLLAGIAYFLVRSFRRRSNGDKPGRGPWTRPDQNEERTDDSSERPVPPMDRHEAARQMWGLLSSDDAEKLTPTTPTSVPHTRGDGFDEVEFLEGAKVFFSRFQQASDEQDFQAIRDFISDEVFNNAMSQPGQGLTEVMLLNARLMEMKSEEGRTIATVFYDAQLRVGDGGQPIHQRVVWEFSRDDTVQGSLWVLEKINKVDQ